MIQYSINISQTKGYQNQLYYLDRMISILSYRGKAKANQQINLIYGARNTRKW